VALSWCKVASNLDTHPKVRKAGRNGREVFLFALRRNAEPGNPIPGRIPKDELEPCYLADLLQMPECDAVTGVTAAVTAGLLALDGDSYAIVSWKDGWGKDNGTGAERTARYRENKKLQADVTPVTSHIVTPSHGDACDTDQKRLEETRREEIIEKNSAAPSAGGEPLDLFKAKVDQAVKARKSKPSEPTAPERAAALRILGKLTERNGIRYSGTTEHIRLIVAQLRNGVDEMHLRYVIGYCAAELEWASDPEMAKYLRPETLFGPKTLSKYLDAALTWVAKLPDDNHQPSAGAA
jgi:uncharacterized phage protein (TIGR02220 family)